MKEHKFRDLTEEESRDLTEEERRVDLITSICRCEVCGYYADKFAVHKSDCEYWQMIRALR